MKDCRQAVQGLTFVGTENWFSSEHEKAITAYLVEGFISAWREKGATLIISAWREKQRNQALRVLLR